MTESGSRQSSPRILPVSAPPSRPSPLSRPHWPYSTYSHRSNSGSLQFVQSTTGAAWESRGPNSSGTLTPGPSGLVRRSSNLNTSTHAVSEDGPNTRHWSFNALEWIVRDVQKLKDYVEGLNDPDVATRSRDNETSGEFEILRESPMLGDGKFKLEIAKPTASDSSESAVSLIRTQPGTLSLYITSVMLEYAHTDYEIYAAMFAGIKCQDDRAGERGARPDWVWEFWQNDWVFREDSEVWECPLPPLSVLLENTRIMETDSFVICVQIHSPMGPFFPQQPSAAYVPKELLDGLEALLDNANTGDVQFICLERKEDSQAPDSVPSSPGTETPQSRRSSSSSSDTSFTGRAVARKRIIYAHSDILTHRSEYFATMFSSAFAENVTPKSPGERKTYTVMVEEADFVTVYWLLKWVYANWLLFKEHDNPKAAIEGVGAGWSAKSLQHTDGSDEWAWKIFTKGMSTDMQEVTLLSDARSVASAESASNMTSAGKGSNQGHSGSQRTNPARSPTTSKAPSSRPPPSPTRRSAAGPPSLNNSSTLAVPLSTASSSPTRSTKSVPMPPPLSTAPSASTFPSSSHYPISPHQRQRPKATADPHPHPTPPPPPASALSMYQVAHRYGMPGLSALALEHMMSTLMPQSSFALLLASSTWDDLHALVEDYVVDKWDEVSVSKEFEQCCEEVAAGEWGVEGGKTLAALFRRLRSPNALGLSRE